MSAQLTVRDALADRLAVLRETLRQANRLDPAQAADEASLGTAFDGMLPHGGLRRGSLIEWLGETRGCGQETLAFAAACRATEEGGTLVVVDRQGTFYPPAATALGADGARILLVRPRTDREALWAFDQALRCSAVSVVWGRMESLPGRSYRRLQLSAEEGGTIGFLLRSTRALSRSAWCDWGVVVRPIPTGAAPRFRIEVVRSRDGKTGRSAELRMDEIDGSIRRSDATHETNPLRLVSPMGRTAASGRNGNRRGDRRKRESRRA